MFSNRVTNFLGEKREGEQKVAHYSINYAKLYNQSIINTLNSMRVEGSFDYWTQNHSLGFEASGEGKSNRQRGLIYQWARYCNRMVAGVCRGEGGAQ